MSKRTPEGAVKAAIMEYLAARRIFAVRMNSGSMFSTYKGKTYLTQMNAPGTADILAFPKWPDTFGKLIPCCLWVEVKAPGGKQSELQKSFQAQVEAEGHSYILARSIDDVAAAL